MIKAVYNQLKKKQGLLLAHSFERFSPWLFGSLLWSVARQHVMAGSTWQRSLFLHDSQEAKWSKGGAEAPISLSVAHSQ